MSHLFVNIVMKFYYVFSILFTVVVVLCSSCKEENLKPACKITSHSNEEEITICDEIAISVDADDPDGNVTKVRVLVDGDGIGIDEIAPYNFIWNTGNYGLGLFSLTAIVYDDAGASASDRINVILVPPVYPPIVEFEANPAFGEAPLSVNFTDLSTRNPESFFWDFGDGSTSSLQNPSHTYNYPGRYTVSLTASNEAATNLETKSNYIIAHGDVQTGEHCPGMPTVSDIDGNIYNTIQVGNQCWLKENLKVTKYPNGDEIPYISDNLEWGALEDIDTDDAYCYPGNNTNSEYGAFYSYSAAIADGWEKDNREGQGICPSGWHLPTNQDWDELEENLILNGFNWDESTTGNKIGKSLASTNGWEFSDQQGAVGNDQESNNSTGFTAYPSGYRSHYDGVFNSNGVSGCWWSATSWHSPYFANFRDLSYFMDRLNHPELDKSRGFSVRCVRDF